MLGLKQVHVKIDSSKMNQTRWELRHNNFTPSLHLVSFRQLPYSWNIDRDSNLAV